MFPRARYLSSRDDGCRTVGESASARADKPMKIAHITAIDMALRYLLLNQLRAAQDAGYQVVGISSPGPERSILEAVGIRHIGVPISRRLTPLRDIVSLWKLYRVLRAEQFTIVHTHTPKPGLLGQLAAHMAGVPVIVNTIHGFYFHDGMHPAWRRFYITVEKVAARHSDMILSINREDIQTAIHEHICAPEKIKYIGEGIDVVRFDPDQVNADDVEKRRAELRVPRDVPVVGFVGRQVREKGLLDLFAAARLVHQHVPTAHFVFIGPVDDAKADAVYPEEADAFGIGDVSRFTGMRLDLPELYALMDVCVLPSYREGFGRALIEAAAMRKPTVATDIRGCREAVEDRRTGFLVPLSDVGALAAAMVELLTDRELAAAMGAAGRERVLERFDERLVFSRVLSEYARLLHAKGIQAPRIAPHEGKATV